VLEQAPSEETSNVSKLGQMLEAMKTGADGPTQTILNRADCEYLFKVLSCAFDINDTWWKLESKHPDYCGADLSEEFKMLRDALEDR
jgi:hypothetical protein